MFDNNSSRSLYVNKLNGNYIPVKQGKISPTRSQRVLTENDFPIKSPYAAS